MLEHYANQASGLLGLASHSGPRMIAVVSHGDEQAELPLLWQLCLALVNFGYPVTVLDATTEESEANPGLEQLLANAPWRADDNRDAPAWAVLPAGNGIQNLCSAHAPVFKNLRQLGHLFPADGVLILYCKVEWMIPLTHGCNIEPLLAVSPVRTSLLTSYLALKRLLITGKLKPTIVNMIPGRHPALHKSAQSVSANLIECAKKFLDHDIKVLDIAEPHDDAGPHDGAVQNLALRLLENAVELKADYFSNPAVARATQFGHFDQFAGSH